MKSKVEVRFSIYCFFFFVKQILNNIFFLSLQLFICTIASKINVTLKGVYLPILKLNSILAVANLPTHRNISKISYCGQISIHSAAVTCLNLTFMGITFILLAIVPNILYILLSFKYI